jgi:hypothetical protein
MHSLDPDRPCEQIEAMSPEPYSPSAAILERMGTALDELDQHRLGWFEAVRQDAAETFPRLGRWRQCRVGCRVPVMDMVVGPLRRNLRTVAERFVTDAAKILSSERGCSAPILELAGRGINLSLIIDPQAADFQFRRGWLQGTIAARRKFEEDMMIHLEAVYHAEIRSHLQHLMNEITQAMAEVEPPVIPALGNTSLGG